MRWRSRRRSEMSLEGLHILIALRHLLRTTLSACSRCLLPPIKRHGLIANAAGEVWRISPFFLRGNVLSPFFL